jgi:hypothetical protein
MAAFCLLTILASPRVEFSDAGASRMYRYSITASALRSATDGVNEDFLFSAANALESSDVPEICQLLELKPVRNGSAAANHNVQS